MADSILHLKKDPSGRAVRTNPYRKPGFRGHGGDRGAPRAKRPFSERDSAPGLSEAARKGATVGAVARAAAALAVRAVEHGKSLSEALPQNTRDLDPRDAALASEIAYGTLRHRRLLSVPLQSLLQHSIPERSDVARAIILCAIYQLAFTRVPARAAVASAAGACPLVHCTHMTGLVNAVLRNFLRQGGSLPDPSTLPEAVAQSVPDWLWNKLRDQYGDQAGAILEAQNEHAPMWLRVSNSRIATDDYLGMLDEEGMRGEASPLCPSAVLLDEAEGVSGLPGFDDGLVSVQDLAAQLAAPLLDVKDGMRVLDCCAAPGGKSAHLMDLCPGIDLTSLDVSPERVSRMQENFKRLGISPRCLEADFATKEGAQAAGDGYDRVLLDAPCSGSGVIRRHPDIKWLRREKDIPSLAQIQSGMLDNAFAALRSGGVLLYTTCSILREENQDQAEAFLRRHPDAHPLPFEMGGQEGYMRQRLPGEDGGDGFFYARFGKD
ncbi:MAG: 16S rRNA (cytosine(967)-C(5))-methyltransferase RsmB [Succinivibrio sp.]